MYVFKCRMVPKVGFIDLVRYVMGQCSSLSKDICHINISL